MCRGAHGNHIEEAVGLKKIKQGCINAVFSFDVDYSLSMCFVYSSQKVTAGSVTHTVTKVFSAHDGRDSHGYTIK